ncbi:MAG: urea carboxylase-associated family protein [Chloroflexi bacterium]|nr:urea carboxylase-associated family protein [Chloroflexota bacterium]
MGEQGYGTVAEEKVIPGGGWAATVVRKGQIIRIVDLQGQQVADFVCFNKDNYHEKLASGNTVMYNRTIKITTGHHLFSTSSRRMFTLLTDKVGVHDIVCGSCSDESYDYRFGLSGHSSCMGNFAKALKPYEIAPHEIPYAFNIFMDWSIAPDGSVTPRSAASKAGDYLDLLAQMDCLVAISVCPQDLTPTNAFNPTPMKYIIYDYRPA